MKRSSPSGFIRNRAVDLAKAPKVLTTGLRRSGLNRRTLLQFAAAAMSIPAIARSNTAFAKDKLAGSGEVVVFSYGGTYTKALRKAVFEPFTQATGISVLDVVADFAEPQVRAMSEAGRVDWDIAMIDAQNYPAMDRAGMFLPIDYGLWDDEAVKGTSQDARIKDAVVAFRSVTMVAYDQRAFPKGGPKNWEEFWDVKNFPGPRGLGPNARHNLVFALQADGVSKSDLWPLTDDKLERAFKKLDQIKLQIPKWWVAGGEPVTLLMNREYAATSCPDGRAIGAIRQGSPLRIVWDGGNLNYIYWTVLKGGPNSSNAQKFIAFVNRAEIAAAYTMGVGYPGPNTNQIKHLPPDLVPNLSIFDENASKLVLQDNAWLVAKRPDGKTNIDYIQERWLAWRSS
ncbi:ABC transporter substrate-binding protein [Bradyrhizobium sp. DASA03005]|uniref:ABC transporter substrate-binding protein n=1 Tax=Bradyrhizobium sp. SPXBL-02 TaxID=3395912 RepID=UPI003F72E04B